MTAKAAYNPAVIEAITSIYKDVGLAAPRIVWTQSPLESYFAKAATDVFSIRGQMHPWYYHWWSRATRTPLITIRQNAVQSLLDNGFKMGGEDSGGPVWDSLFVYQGDNSITWQDLPANINTSWQRREDLPAWLQERSAIGIGSTIDQTLEMHRSDFILDLWARHRFQMDNIGRKRRGGSRSMHLRMIRDKGKLRRQKDLSFVPKHLPGFPKQGMKDDFVTLREFAGHIFPYQTMCFVSERPNVLKVDAQDRLHCPDGPAAAYPDGFEVHAWRGELYPAEWVDKMPSAEWALRITNLETRRIACEMLGWDKILKEVKAKRINKDRNPEIGELLRVELPDFGQHLFLRVKCGTGRDFVLPVPPSMKTAQQANAWTWGLPTNEYAPEVRT